jgi:flagellar basal-body rod modification protein FlgD
MQTNPLINMAPPSSASSQATGNSGGILGKDDFLKVLVGEMSNMDPLASDQQDPTQSIAQMAQFSIVEQLTNLTQSSQKTAAMGMLGKTVTYKSASGGTTQGTVESVDTSGGDPTLTVDGKPGVALSQITQVQ